MKNLYYLQYYEIELLKLIFYKQGLQNTHLKFLSDVKNPIEEEIEEVDKKIQTLTEIINNLDAKEKLNMNLKEAYEVTKMMTINDDRNPTIRQREAKNIIFNEVISKKWLKENQGKSLDDIPSYLEPDAEEGWKTYE